MGACLNLCTAPHSTVHEGTHVRTVCMYVRMCPVRQQLIPTRLHLQKIVECLHYLAFSQEQDLHEEAL